MKKIFMVASLAAGLTLITSCSVKLTEDNKNSDYNNTIYRGMPTHNFSVLNNKLDKIIENQERIFNNPFPIFNNQEQIIKWNKEMLEILRKQ